MSGRRFWLVPVLMLGAIALPSCHHTSNQVANYPPPRPAPCNTCVPAGPLPPRFSPTPGPTVPAGGFVPSGELPGSPMPQGPAGLSDPGWRSVPEASTPPLPTEQPRAGVKLYAPQTEEPPALSIAPAAPKEQALEQAPRPVDIPQFAIALPNVGSGLQPFPDGVAWLQEKGYRTVLHLRQPGEDDGIARKVFEKRSLRFLSLEVSPRSLMPETVEAFNRIVTTEPNLPLYVYDKDGSLAGGMWYLYFRLAAKATDEKARAEAERLGLRPDADGDYRTMWVAVQNYLANQPK